MAKRKSDRFIRWFEDISNRDVALVGGKNASLGEMYSHLARDGVTVPNGFAITTTAYNYFLKSAKLDKVIASILRGLNTHNIRDLQERGKKVRKLIIEAPLPKNLANAITKAYHTLSKGTNRLDVAVRSSATAEDLPGASFAGQLETYLNIHGLENLLKSITKAFASLYTDRAISYRKDKGFSERSVALSVGVQMMVRSDLAVAGVIFTLDTESGFDKVIIINAAYGLGENVVQGKVTPDLYTVFKPTLGRARMPILEKVLGDKAYRMVYSKNPQKPTANIPVSKNERNKYSLENREIITLAKYALTIEKHYGRPMDIEWAKDGRDNKLYIVQARPETVHAGKKKLTITSYHLLQKGEVLAKGRSVGASIASGKARIIKDVGGMHVFKQGEILVTKITDPDWEPIMKIAAGIVTDTGGRTSHAAIVARELGIPAVVGTGNVSKVVTTGAQVTLSCAEGEIGYLYKGKLRFKVTKTTLKKIPKIKTKVMLILGEPDTAFQHSFLPVSGVGLARLEFIINNSVQIHPMALTKFTSLKDKNLKAKIEKLTVSYKDKKSYFIDKLSWGVAQLAAGFYPNDVIVRFSDLKSNEYANLIGGKLFEPHEANPMLGWRGASRYYHESYEPAFALECKALRRVREQIGLTNVKVMIPFCRTINEAKLVLETMERYGLKRGERGLEIYMMVEIPSNILLAHKFAKYFDGFSIGSNDLTQLTLGLDRDSSIVAKVGDERNEAVKKFMAQVIATAKKAGIKIGICGQAPSDFPEIATFLVREGIDSISVSPDRAIPTILNVAKAEKSRK